MPNFFLWPTSQDLTRWLLLREMVISPDACSHVARSSGKIATCWARCHADNAVFVTLEHELCLASGGVPKLDASVLRARENPLVIGCKSHAQHKVLKYTVSKYQIMTFAQEKVNCNLPCGLRKSGCIYLLWRQVQIRREEHPVPTF